MHKPSIDLIKEFCILFYLTFIWYFLIWYVVGDHNDMIFLFVLEH